MTNSVVARTLFGLSAALATACSAANEPPAPAPPAASDVAAVPSAEGSAVAVEASGPNDVGEIPPPPVAPTDTPAVQNRDVPSDLDIVSTLQARDLVGTSWNAAAPGARFARIEFLEQIVTFTTVEGQIVSFAADYSAQSSECGAFPGCVLVLESNNTVRPFLFARSEDTLFHVACLATGNVTRDEWEIARANEMLNNRVVVHDFVPAFCWNTVETPYIQAPPVWFRAPAVDEAASAGGEGSAAR